MRAACGFLLIVFLLSVMISYGQGEDNSALQKLISLEIHQESIATVLENISSREHVYFSYDPVLIDADKKINASFTLKPIAEVLDILFEGKFNYKVLGNQIVITLPQKGQGENDTDKSPDLQSRGTIFRGLVIDYDEKQPLPFASISVLGKSIGTISNSDGNFELKIPGSMIRDTVVLSCMGYKQFRIPVRGISPERATIYLHPISFPIQEIKVVYISPQEILRRMQAKISLNYPEEPEIMTSFYREVLRQDDDYIDVAEAVMDIRKASYTDQLAEDRVKFIKGRKSLNVKPFQFVDFKIQGGPYYITKLDVVKTMDSFLDPEFEPFYKYSLEQVVEFDNRSTYVISFKPKEKEEEVYYQGKLYVDMSSFALVKAEFEMNRSGLKFARQSLIQKKPKDFLVRPVRVHYQVNYRRSDTHWHLSNARASINFRVKSKKDKINSSFHSVSELLVTDFKPDEGNRFKRNEVFSSKDIFTEMINNHDDNFWDDYNTIVPSEDLRKALQKYYQENDSLFNSRSTHSKE